MPVNTYLDGLLASGRPAQSAGRRSGPAPFHVRADPPAASPAALERNRSGLDLRAVRPRLHADVRRAGRDQLDLRLLFHHGRVPGALWHQAPGLADLAGAAGGGRADRPDRDPVRRGTADAAPAQEGAGTGLAHGDARRNTASLFA